MLSIIILLYHKKLELRKRFKFRSAALWKREEYEVTLFGSERITKRRTLSVRTEMSLLVLPYTGHSMHSRHTHTRLL